jgi:hypothetical protein
MRCNLFEAALYRRVSAPTRAQLCPVLWASWFGVLNIMQKAIPISEREAAYRRKADNFIDWALEGSDDDWVFEPKASDWGRLRDGRLVALDYSGHN